MAALRGTICTTARRGDYVVRHNRQIVILVGSKDDLNYEIGKPVQYVITDSSPTGVVFSGRGNYSLLETEDFGSTEPTRRKR